MVAENGIVLGSKYLKDIVMGGIKERFAELRRLGVLRESSGAPLPGKVVVRSDLQRQLFDKANCWVNVDDWDEPKVVWFMSNR